MKILITGGLGYIGAHTTVEAHLNKHQTVLVDNLYYTSRSVVDDIESITGIRSDFYEYDVTDKANMETLFKSYNFDAVIHFAGYKAVGESVSHPLMYYQNNLTSTLVLAELCIKYDVPHLIFSSSATVYGDQVSPLKETMTLKETTNPYGETKKMSERILMDAARAHENFHVTLLRYFNPVGAHPSGLIGENPNGIPNNLMPYITRVASGSLQTLQVFGNDYDTLDGTGVRDYIHVVDLAKGHLAALHTLKEKMNIYNLGTGQGISVLQMVETFKKVNGVDIPYIITQRRPGDIATSYADASKAYEMLNWKATHTLEDMVRDAWHYEQMKKDQ